MKIKIIRELPLTNNEGQIARILIEREGKFYVASQINNIMGRETLIFPSDNDGNITSYLEAFGRRDTCVAETINEFENVEPMNWDLD